MKYLIWDFDGTLAYHRRGLWGGVLLDLLSEAAPDLRVRREDLRPHLAAGFPWHAPERAHPELDTPEKWWDDLNPVFERAFIAVGVEPDLARVLAQRVREGYTDPANWRLFDETLGTLDELSSMGWTHLVLPSHVPELLRIMCALGLEGCVVRTFNSAESGYEKPNPRAFDAVTTATRNADAVWMIGDSMDADARGAESVGIPAILVRRRHDDAERFCEDLSGVPEFVGET